MAYWLMKSEPDVYGIDHLAAEPDGTEHWDGIRNYQVRNLFRDRFQPGDQAFFYHSNTKVPGIVGIMEVVSEAYPDHTAFDPDEKYYDPKSDPDHPRWLMVDVRYIRHLDRLITLAELKADPALADMRLVQRGNRLSVMPVSEVEWQHILDMEKQDGNDNR
ncbi:EVE domain-containing protein [Spiribacter curvatus]|nr:EVE domain-containing protein [Spiribacter curvatus]